MIFSSSIFLFFPSVFFINLLLKENMRNLWLLFTSLFFYWWGEPKFLPIMIGSILFNYGIGILMDAVKEKLLLKRLVLMVAITGNLGLLFYFKYLDFFIQTVNRIFQKNVPYFSIALPIGISFFTFQGLSYTIDLYRNHTTVQKNVSKLALYIALFPQLIAGPIVRYTDIQNQLDQRELSVTNTYHGLKRFILGLAKKTLIANQLGYATDQIFSVNPEQHVPLTLWIGVIFYSMQIYFDFSGYSDMAIGIGRMLGFVFPENFNDPYISKSIKEFWRRWHISLSSFFKDYLYIPLGGNRKGQIRTLFNLLVVFLCTGIWHGAQLTFLLWGLWHGMFLILEKQCAGVVQKVKIPNIWKHVYTLLIVVIGWVFFRSSSVKYAIRYLCGMFGLLEVSNVQFGPMYFVSTENLCFFLVSVFFAFGGSSILSRYLKEKKPVIVDVLYMIAFCWSVITVMTATYNPFIYFRF